MITAQAISYEFNEEDWKLLRVLLPSNPCTDCSSSNNGACCGCDNARVYEAIMKPYDAAHITNVAIEIQSLVNLNKELEKLESKIRSITDDMKDKYGDANFEKMREIIYR